MAEDSGFAVGVVKVGTTDHPDEPRDRLHEHLHDGHGHTDDLNNVVKTTTTLELSDEDADFKDAHPHEGYHASEDSFGQDRHELSSEVPHGDYHASEDHYRQDHHESEVQHRKEDVYGEDLHREYESKLSFDAEKHELEGDESVHAKRNVDNDRFGEAQERSFDDGDYREGEDRYELPMTVHRMPDDNDCLNSEVVLTMYQPLL
ncbi:hypothetical protein AAVH_09724 [Aphelenchoides avenae]|nr:hypothetical protein AAVH_09724 [Aphelenchus avenae]